MNGTLTQINWPICSDPTNERVRRRFRTLYYDSSEAIGAIGTSAFGDYDDLSPTTVCSTVSGSAELFQVENEMVLRLKDEVRYAPN